MTANQGQATAVVIYSTPGCGRCQAAAEFFSSLGHPVTILDVANDFGALRRMARISNGARTVPVIQWGQVVTVGFEPDFWREKLGAGA
ncbi:MAG: glutaredoxin family protein [Thermodesulfobacteriota bacterium]